MTGGGWAEVVFWVSMAGVFYPYAGYPLLLAAMGRLVRRPSVAPADKLPRLTMIVPVHNEASRVTAKIENTLAHD